jgi:1,4-alpha-glucan branching enzyme
VDAFTELDRRLFEAGRHDDLHRVLGAHPAEVGTWFGLWAPHARSVQVFGEFDGWGAGRHELARGPGGIWSGLVLRARAGQLYKYRVVTEDGAVLDKADPFAAATETPPATASRIASLDYEWGDGDWMRSRAARQSRTAPISIYELHLGSWLRGRSGLAADEGYRAVAAPLAEHVLALGCTHVELLPLMEHPFYGSWGYQTTGYFAPTSRYGTPQDLMYLIDTLHQRGIGVILDWTPAHFADDPHGLGEFDGTPLYEHADPRRGRHAKWGTLVFDYERPEVRSFLISSAASWFERYHADGLRVDAVTSMLHRDFARGDGEWVANGAGGRENFEAAQLLRDLNDAVHGRFPGVHTYAEESEDWPLVTHPVSEGGLGFDFTWDVGWSHDTLAYLRHEPSERPVHHRGLTFHGLYASGEHFLLPLSHDEVSDGLGTLLAQMPGDEGERLANVRALLGYQFATPGKKLIFMGAELASTVQWDHDRGLEWGVAGSAASRGLQRWITALNELYRRTPVLSESDGTPEGREWVIADDAEHSVFAFERRAATGVVLVVANFAATRHESHRVGVSVPGAWDVLLASDAPEFGGGGPAAAPGVEAEALPSDGRRYSIALGLPPLSITFLAPRHAP